MKHYSAMKKKEIMPFAAMWIDLEGIMLSKIVRQILYDITYMWNLKKKYNKLVSITERQTHRYRGQVSDSHWEAGRQYRYGSMRGANSGF